MLNVEWVHNTVLFVGMIVMNEICLQVNYWIKSPYERVHACLKALLSVY